MNEVEIQRQKEMQQAEELLFSGHQELGFANGLFLGKFVAEQGRSRDRREVRRRVAPTASRMPRPEARLI